MVLGKSTEKRKAEAKANPKPKAKSKNKKGKGQGAVKQESGQESGPHFDALGDNWGDEDDEMSGLGDDDDIDGYPLESDENVEG